MRYTDSRDRSAENLRLALAHMGRQPAGLHPLSYAIWYEHVAGINRDLSDAIQAIQAQGRLLDDSDTQQLYGSYIANLDMATAQRVSNGIVEVLDSMSDTAAVAGSEANRFGDSLAFWAETVPDTDHLQRLLLDTRQMQTAMKTLGDRLEESRREVDRLKQEVANAREEALQDNLTGLGNRRAFDQAIAACLGGPAESAPCLLLGDIDHFKRINDNYGHLFGDRVLQSIAQILRASIKGADLAARYGGEEFAILLPDTRLEDAGRLAEKIRSTVAGCRIRRSDGQDASESVTISFGVARMLPGETPEALLTRTDAALYTAKHGGRNRVSLSRTATT